MTLSEKFADNFTPDCQMTGRQIFARGQCQILSAADDAVCAEVQDGADLYESSWKLVDRRLRPACDCPHPPETLCPHLWATLLAAEQHGDLQQALKRNVPKRIVVNAKTPSDDVRLEPVKQRSHTRARQQPAPAAPLLRASRTQQATMLYVLRLEEQRPEHITFQLAWRPHTPPGSTAPPPPARTFHYTPETIIDSPVLAQLLTWSIREKSTSSSVTIPDRYFADFLDLLDAHNLLRWTSACEKPPRIHPLIPITSGTATCRPRFTPTSPSTWTLEAYCTIDGKDIPASSLKRLWHHGATFSNSHAFVIRFRETDDLLRHLATQPPRTLPTPAAIAQARELVAAHACDTSDLPRELQPRVQTLAPQGQLYVKTALYKFQGHEMLHADLSFDYAGTMATYRDPAELLPTATPGTLLKRDLAAEDALAQRLEQLGFRWNNSPAREEIGWKLPPAQLENAVMTLVSEDWLVTAQGKSFRKPTTKTASINANGNWFELEAGADYGTFHVPLPQLLEAKNKGHKTVRLDDGTFGILPLDWLENFTALTELGDRASDKIRFKQQQAAIINELVAKTQVSFDQTFRQTADNLRQLTETTPPAATPTPQFQATLRPYQLQGLAWLLNMARQGLGACLADDMGLGKTIQILAFIDVRRHRLPKPPPALVVMPRSLLFNWQDEAKRFAPHLAVITYTGPQRNRLRPLFKEADIILTTYGTLRNDAPLLANVLFDACILDESQAIKNADSATALACRTIQAVTRVAMTGTPIENKLAELLAQLDFINPGLMGHLLENHNLNAQRLSDDTFNIIRHAVRCFILRRTKHMVAKSLPPKTEQVLWVELEDTEQQQYNALRDHFRQQLTSESSTPTAAASSPLDALTALLKLRQAACHPALVFKDQLHATSAKLTLLNEKISALTAENHKVLVFSQFTSLLRLVADNLLQLNLTYAYLDGQTADRQAPVKLFQDDPDTKVFLISLKAGGVGLNLTAADYVFILDPWWNPAAEAQAIDRAYRIGQNKPVFAYKLIAKNTVEEKVLQLQQAKQKLADTYLKTNAKPYSLSPQDLLFLLS